MNRATQDTTSVQQLVDGYVEDARAYTCLFCGERFERGRIFGQPGDLADAELATRRHLTQAHGSVFQALLDLGKKGTGLTDTQAALLGHLHAGRSDREIQPLAGNVSLSTIRNQRFVLREKARQARVMVALTELVARRESDPGGHFIEIPGSASADDERFAITRDEFDRMIKLSFPDGPDGPMASFPRKEKRKIAVMIQVLKRFDPARRYTQQEVNAVLATATDDHTTLCRFMVDYGFLERTRDGSAYWVA